MGIEADISDRQAKDVRREDDQEDNSRSQVVDLSSSRFGCPFDRHYPRTRKYITLVPNSLAQLQPRKTSIQTETIQYLVQLRFASPYFVRATQTIPIIEHLLFPTLTQISSEQLPLANCIQDPTPTTSDSVSSLQKPFLVPSEASSSYRCPSSSTQIVAREGEDR